MRTKPLQLSVMAVAALAVFAVAAVMLLAGGAPAQADTTATLTAAGVAGTSELPPDRPIGQVPPPPPPPTPDSTPEPIATPEPCPGQTGNDNSVAHVVSSGHYAVIEAYWDAGDKNLVNNPCPPEVTHNADETVTRTASGINIEQTIMHVSGNSNLTPRANNADDYEQWPFLYPDAADKDENNTIDGSEIGAPYSANVWALHDCDHDADPPPTEDDLCIGVSAGLFRASDWKSFKYEVESIREPGIAAADRGQAFVFYKHDDVPADTNQVLWGTHDTANTGIDVTAGEYLHPRWAFTEPGTYRFQVHANGELVEGSSLSGASSATSIVRTYTIHVGDLSDLGVTVTASDHEPNVGQQITYTVTASNLGPDDAQGTTVRLELPDGDDLTGLSASTQQGSYADGVWTIGSLCHPATNECPSEATLTITGTVGQNTHGKPLPVTANIKATETIGTSTVDELDPTEANNTATATAEPDRVENVNPIFKIERTLAENTAPGTALGDPVLVRDDAGESFTFSLHGHDANRFAVDNATGQISVAQGAFIDYECRTNYKLNLHVSDNKDTNGNADEEAVDDVLGVDIQVTNVDEDLNTDPVEDPTFTPTITVTAGPSPATVNHSITLTVTADLPPCGKWYYAYERQLKNTQGHLSWSRESGSGPTHVFSSDGLTGERQYKAILRYETVGRDSFTFESEPITVNWQD